MKHLSCRSCGRLVILGPRPAGEWCECTTPQLSKGGPGRGLPVGASPGVVNNSGSGPVLPVRLAVVGRKPPSASQLSEARSGAYRPSEWDVVPAVGPEGPENSTGSEPVVSQSLEVLESTDSPGSPGYLLEEPEELGGPF